MNDVANISTERHSPAPVGPTMNPLVPAAVLYAGLAGVLLALIVSTAHNKWQLRVFVLLALRLAIGWHFLFEGLHKVQSTYVGPTDTNKVFTSEPYFAVAEGPFGEALRKEYLGDPARTYTEWLEQKEPMTAAEFEKLPVERQAEYCPAIVAGDLNAAMTQPDGTSKTLPDAVQILKAKYARWVYGVDRRDTKVTHLTGSEGALQASAPERLHYIALLQTELSEFQARQKYSLGQGNGLEMTRAKKAQTDLQAAQTELAADCKAFVKELKTGAGVDAKDEIAEKPILQIDRLTRWAITAIGAGLLLGLFTRAWCIAGIGFLVMTYLSHPTVPWLSLPPGTEGNPLFINKNLIEALGLLVILAHPTGRWLGLDALIHRLVFPRSPDPA